MNSAQVRPRSRRMPFLPMMRWTSRRRVGPIYGAFLSDLEPGQRDRLKQMERSGEILLWWCHASCDSEILLSWDHGISIIAEVECPCRVTVRRDRDEA